MVSMLNAGAHDLPLANLSSREMQILVLIGKGKPYDEIAEILRQPPTRPRRT